MYSPKRINKKQGQSEKQKIKINEKRDSAQQQSSSLCIFLFQNFLALLEKLNGWLVVAGELC